MANETKTAEATKAETVESRIRDAAHAIGDLWWVHESPGGWSQAKVEAIAHIIGAHVLGVPTQASYSVDNRHGGTIRG